MSSTPKVLAICGGGLGYDSWLKVKTEGWEHCDVILLKDGSRAHCHPVIRAERIHSEAIEGVDVGDLICGVRWTD